MHVAPYCVVAAALLAPAGFLRGHGRSDQPVQLPAMCAPLPCNIWVMLPAAYRCVLQKLCQMTVTPFVPNFFATVVSCDACQSRLKTGRGVHSMVARMTDNIESTCAFTLLASMQCKLTCMHSYMRVTDDGCRHTRQYMFCVRSVALQQA